MKGCAWDVITSGWHALMAIHCHGCGRPYPWTERSIQALTEAVELAAEDLSADERDALKDAIPDLIAETPRTQIAAARFKKAITKAGAFGGKFTFERRRECYEPPR